MATKLTKSVARETDVTDVYLDKTRNVVISLELPSKIVLRLKGTQRKHEVEIADLYNALEAQLDLTSYSKDKNDESSSVTDSDDLPV